MDASQLRRLVDAFYADVRRDPQLGPVFERVIGPDWNAHLDRIHDFWCTIALHARSFQGNVRGKHMAIDGLTPGLFDRWLALWQQHTEQVLAPDDAQALQHTARGIARHLRHGLTMTRSETT